MSRNIRKVAFAFVAAAGIGSIIYLHSAHTTVGPRELAEFVGLSPSKDAAPSKHQSSGITVPELNFIDASAPKGPQLDPVTGRPKACIVILTRNSEMGDLIKTLRTFERQFNNKFGYPYVMLNEVPFSEEFKREIVKPMGNRTNPVLFGLVPKSHWSYPPWISKTKAAQTRVDMKSIIYGDSESYRFMCHYQSGYFFRHPLLDQFDYYWRVEPGTKLVCDIPYDPFMKMFEKKLKYGFTIAIGEFKETVLSLWEATMNYVGWRKSNDPTFNPELLKFFSSDDKKEYNMRHFWSNFEIADLNFLRSDEYISYFELLDHFGGFFYERWGDAPVHSLGVGLFLKKEEVHFFEDIGYFHNPLTHCPAEPFHTERNCDCNREKSADNIKHWSCVDQWNDYKPSSWFAK